MIFAAREYVRHLQAEVEFWRLQFEHERKRAEEAINELLRDKVVNVLTAQPPRPPRRDPMELIEELAKDPEFAQAGEAG